MSVKVWNTELDNSLIKSHDKHREFVNDCNYSLHQPNLIISGSLDKRFCIFNS